MIIEVCVDSLESAVTAMKAGADQFISHKSRV